jgi:hypothetical protein
LPRDLSDVLHYFGPELAQSGDSQGRHTPERPVSAARSLAPQIIGVPIGDRDVVRAAFTWNLAVEIARLGGRASVIAPDDGSPSPLWPQAGTGPLGVELRPTLAKDLKSLDRIAQEAASTTALRGGEPGLIFVRIPPTWLAAGHSDSGLLRWTLLLTSSRTSDLKEILESTKMIVRSQPQARVGVTIHGAECRKEAETAFGRVAGASRRDLKHDVRSYGLLVDDLHVYRAIVAQRPIGLAHPQSPAARALRDVAQLLLADSQQDPLD